MTQAANLAALGTNAGTTGILPAAGGGTGTASGVTGFKNRIINGGMVISQYNGTSSVTPTDGQYSVDRWTGRLTQSSKYTLQQNAGSVTPPVGFTNYLGATSSSAYSVTSGDFFLIEQWIEGFNTADLGWGTANAKTVTLSFWVRSSLTGTFGGSLRTYAGGYSYPFSYSISSANTWEQKSITVTGAPAGTWNTTNSGSIGVAFSLGAGSSYSGTAGAWVASGLLSATGAVSVVGTNGATFYITGVQLEVGSTATNFDVRSYGTELALCQRYCQVSKGSDGVSNNYVRIGYGPCQNSTSGIVHYKPLVTFRTSPTIIATGNFAVYDGVTITATTAVSIDGATTPYLVVIAWSVSGGGMTATRAYEYIINNSSTTTFVLSAEL
jgi:hypothetical protein